MSAARQTHIEIGSQPNLTAGRCVYDVAERSRDSDPEALVETLPGLEALLDVFDGAPRVPLPPKPTLADAGSVERRQAPGRAARDRSQGLSDAGWARFADGFKRAVERCRERGYEPTLHPETGTYVEAAWEIERVLESTDVGLCLETGHMVIGGDDPAAAIKRWGERINHVHLKDVRVSLVQGLIGDRAGTDAIWQRRAFCPLGAGDLPIADLVSGVVASGYAGWLVFEQDIMPSAADAGRPSARRPTRQPRTPAQARSMTSGRP